MSDEQLNSLKEQLAPLSPQEKLKLARFLIDQAGLDQQGNVTGWMWIGATRLSNGCNIWPG